MATQTATSLVLPQLSVYDARRDEDTVLRNVGIDADYVRDADGKVVYFDVDEGHSYLRKQGKSMPSLPVLVNLYLALSELAATDETAARIVRQLNSAWDRTGTSVSPAGRLVHSDSVLGEMAYNGLAVPAEGNTIDRLFSGNERFFRALLGIRDIDRLARAAGSDDRVPFYWYPRGERRAMFGGGDFYYMHQYLPGLLMVFCDDEPHPRRVLRGVWLEK